MYNNEFLHTHTYTCETVTTIKVTNIFITHRSFSVPFAAQLPGSRTEAIFSVSASVFVFCVTIH